MEASRSVSPEYRTLVQHTSDLQLAVRHDLVDLVDLGGKLVSSTFITPDQYEHIRNSQSPTGDRAAYLIHLIQSKVKQDRQYYHVFTRVLSSNLAQYGGILQLLHQTFHQQSEQQLIDTGVTHGQAPPFNSFGMYVY